MEYDDDKTGPDYPSCLGCPNNTDSGDGLCGVPGPCQAHPNAERLDTPEPDVIEPAPLPVTTDNGSLFDNAA